MVRRFGSKEGVMRFLAKERIDEFKRAMKINPAGLYHNIFASQG